MSEETEDSAEEFIDFKCPYCGADTSFRADDAGAVEECPFCPEIFVVPLKNGEPGRQIPIPIATPRLSLRRLRLEDNADLAEFMGDEELGRYMEGTSMDEDAISEWLKRDRSSKFLRPGNPLWLGIVLQEKEKLIGWTWLDYSRHSFGLQPDQQARFSLVLNRAYQRKGYGLEVVQNLLRFGFAGVNLRRITAACDSRNAAAKALLTKAGLRFEGEFFQERFVKDECVDTSYFAMLAEEHHGGGLGRISSQDKSAGG